MPLFRKTRLDLPTVMSGAKLGDRVLILGCTDTRLIAALGAKTGLTGRACAVDESEARAAEAARVAAREGSLVETMAAPLSSLPFDPESFDLIVIRDILASLSADNRARVAQEARRVLRPGGRCVVIETLPRTGLSALIHRGTVEDEYLAAGGAPRALEGAGFAATRTLAEQDGLRFVEGVKRKA